MISSLPRQMFDTVAVVVAQVKLQVFRACGGGSKHDVFPTILSKYLTLFIEVVGKVPPPLPHDDAKAL